MVIILPWYFLAFSLFFFSLNESSVRFFVLLLLFGFFSDLIEQLSASLVAAGFLTGQQSRGIIYMALEKNKQTAKSPWYRIKPALSIWISCGRETTLVIGVKEKCASYLSWGPLCHTFLRPGPTVGHMLTEPFALSPPSLRLLNLCPRALMPASPPPPLQLPLACATLFNRGQV